MTARVGIGYKIRMIGCLLQRHGNNHGNVRISLGAAPDTERLQGKIMKGLESHPWLDSKMGLRDTASAPHRA
jgi:hypothetical protein